MADPCPQGFARRTNGQGTTVPTLDVEGSARARQSSPIGQARNWPYVLGPGRGDPSGVESHIGVN